jgi:hypothetical protein
MKAPVLVAAVLLACPLFSQDTGAKSDNRSIEIKGQIAKVGIARGQGMPSLDVKADSGKTWKVWLGSMRFLMEQNFSPKAGQDVRVKGFPATAADEMTAQTVTLTETKQTIRLRDEQGFPLWRGPMGRGRRGSRWGGPN